MFFVPVNHELEESNTILMSVNNSRKTKCTYLNCKYETDQPAGMRKHFRSRHPNDIIILQEEGLLPQCPKCNIFQKNAMTTTH